MSRVQTQASVLYRSANEVSEGEKWRKLQRTNIRVSLCVSVDEGHRLDVISGPALKTKLKLKNTKNGTAQRTLHIDLILYYRELNSVL